MITDEQIIKVLAIHNKTCQQLCELLAVTELLLQYTQHPDVLEITQNMALPGSAANERARAAIAKVKGISHD